MPICEYVLQYAIDASPDVDVILAYVLSGA